MATENGFELALELAPSCARFLRIPFTPIDSMAKISYTLISHFCVDHFEFAHLSCYHIKDSLSSDSFGVLDISNPVARYFLYQSNPRYVFYSEAGIRACQSTFRISGMQWKFMARAPIPVNPKAFPPPTNRSRSNTITGNIRSKRWMLALKLEFKDRVSHLNVPKPSVA